MSSAITLWAGAKPTVCKYAEIFEIHTAAIVQVGVQIRADPKPLIAEFCEVTRISNAGRLFGHANYYHGIAAVEILAGADKLANNLQFHVAVSTDSIY